MTVAVFAGTFGTVFIVKLSLFGLMVILAAIATVVLTRQMQKGLRDKVVLGSAASEITSATLPSHDGREGRRGIVAVSGKLYEVTESRLWRNGSHIKQHQAGQYLTAALESAPHGPEVLEKVPMIGELLGTDAAFPSTDCTDRATADAVNALGDGQVAVLENLRFHPGEKANDPDFTRSLVAPCSHYVNDAFGTAHRALGYQPEVISPPLLTHKINTYTTITDAIGYVYQLGGYMFH